MTHVSTHSRLKAAVAIPLISLNFSIVSTHSRLKAAAKIHLHCLPMISFNTQPPEGGWKM